MSELNKRAGSWGSAVQTQAIEYTGDGSSSNYLKFDFDPDMVIISGAESDYSIELPLTIFRTMESAVCLSYRSGTVTGASVTLAWGEKTLEISGSTNEGAMNIKRKPYIALAFKFG